VSPTRIPPSVVQDIGPLCEALSARGFIHASSQLGPMHSYVVRFVHGRDTLTIVADKGQLQLDGDYALLSSIGMWRAFDDYEEFTRCVLDALPALGFGAAGSRKVP
jgi:hypothetical protein